MPVVKHSYSDFKKKHDEFLDSRRTKNVSEYNVGSMDPPGKFVIPSGSYPVFLNSVQRLVSIKTENAKTPISDLCLTERGRPVAPFRVDVDIRQSVGQRLYRLKEVEALIAKIFEILESIKDPSYSYTPCCVLLEKPRPKEDEKTSTDEIKLYKDGFHLHFNFNTDQWTYKYISSKLGVWFNDLGPTGPFDNTKPFISVKNDEGIHGAEWLIYGCAKKRGEFYYSATHFYEFDSDTGLYSTSVEEAFEHFGTPVATKKVEDKRYYLPTMLSVVDKIPTPLCPEIIKEKQTTVIKETRRPSKGQRREEDILRDLAEIRDGQYLEHLSQFRADDYKLWNEVGMTLYGISDGSEDGLDLWVEFSRRSDKFKDGECEKIWNKYPENKRTIASLIYMLNEDDPEYVKTHRKQQWEHLFKEAIRTEPTHLRVALIIHRMKKGMFIYSEDKKWYSYGDHKSLIEVNTQRHYWKKMVEEVDLRLYIQTELRQYYMDYAENKKKELREQKASNGEDTSDKSLNKLASMSNVNKMISCLETSPFINAVIAICKTYFHMPNFEKIKNSQKNLLGCENGVIDLDAKIFRPGRPDDYITMSTKINFNPIIDTQEEELLDSIMRKIYTDKSHYEYVMKLCAASLYGKNIMKTIPCHIGPTNAGKSGLICLMRNALGEYCKDLKKEKVTKTSIKSAGGPDVEMMRLQSARWVVVPELEKKDILDIAFVKTITASMDKYYARGMQDNEGLDMVITFTIIFQLNDFPKVPGEDEAFWQRVLCIPYYSKFVKPTEMKEFPIAKTVEEQMKQRRFKADLNIESVMQRLAPTWLAKLFKVWCDSVSKYSENPEVMTPPREFIDRMDTERRRFDTISAFVKDTYNLVPTTGLTDEEKDNCFQPTKTIFKAYGEWYTTTYPMYKNSNYDLNSFIDIFSLRTKKKQITRKKSKGFMGLIPWIDIDTPDDDCEDDEEGDE